MHVAAASGCLVSFLRVRARACVRVCGKTRFHWLCGEMFVTRSEYDRYERVCTRVLGDASTYH
jgi:hypothetical protein